MASRDVYSKWGGLMDKHAKYLSKFLQTKKGNIIYFNSRDIYLNQGTKERTKQLMSDRRGLGTWISKQLRLSDVIIDDFKITIFENKARVKYLATRQ